MTREEAIRAFIKGKKVRNIEWPACQFIYENDDYTIIDQNGIECNFYIFSPQGADSWEVVEEPEFKITETGLYKTRDGRKAFVHYFDYDGDVRGVVARNPATMYWTVHGLCANGYVYTEEDDIVSKWVDE